MEAAIPEAIVPQGSDARYASFTLHGAGVSGGIAIGYAHLISTARLEVAHYEVAPEHVEEEVERFDNAVAQVRGELMGLHARCPRRRRPRWVRSSTCT